MDTLLEQTYIEQNTDNKEYTPWIHCQSRPTQNRIQNIKNTLHGYTARVDLNRIERAEYKILYVYGLNKTTIYALMIVYKVKSNLNIG